MNRKLLYGYIHRFCLFGVMVTVVFLIRKISVKTNFYKNVPIETFVGGKTLAFRARQICA